MQFFVYIAHVFLRIRYSGLGEYFQPSFTDDHPDGSDWLPGLPAPGLQPFAALPCEAKGAGFR